MLVSDFDFHLPDELIAQQPLASRDASRMLHVQRSTGKYSDQSFHELPDLLRPEDLVVFNNTRVLPARLYGRREARANLETGGQDSAAHQPQPSRIEVLLTRQVSGEPNDWECLVRPGRKITVGQRLFFGDSDQLQAEVIARAEYGERQIRFLPEADFFGLLDRLGHVPLPPYISRSDSPCDRERYQTVYAQAPGSVAAPTAGLHFTRESMQRIHRRGVETVAITLHVGLGTFQPIRVERVEDHPIHAESYLISEEAAAAINRALSSSRRIIAIGTTTVRTLEHAVRMGSGSITAGPGLADLFIYPGFEFQAVSALLTNFHLPQSTLLMLVCAFAGKQNILRAYEHAVSERYRFYSYGDCMFIE